MKKIILSTAAALLFSLGIAQTKDNNVVKQGEIMKIPLLEKFNLPARKLPEILVKAWCEGLIQGYYPLQVDSACSYHNFMRQFGFGRTQPIPSADEFTDIQCPQSFCDNPNDPVLEQFKHNFEIIQNKRFDKNLSTEVYDIKYIRLIYVKEKGDQMFDLLGPVFKFEDVIKLNRPDFKLTNAKNAAADFTLKQYFETRMFHGYIIQTSLLKSNNPDEKKNKEKDMWEH
ncbi:MAG: hypothetical protein K0S33_4206 [Bacteroidetes bacterium]|jgi:hypothetical protein|nr:hypothetical protein [Bacteroidota bacterium]